MSKRYKINCTALIFFVNDPRQLFSEIKVWINMTENVCYLGFVDLIATEF